MTRHLIAGARPEPLGAYLAGLGLIRVLAEQVDPELTATWTDEGLVLDTTVGRLGRVDGVAEWLVDHYRPTPVLSPWNEGSGFGAKDRTPKTTLAALLAHPSTRLDPFRTAMREATRVGEALRDPATGWSKERAVREFRNRCPEPLLPWIDAAVVLAADQAYFPPLLGTGGNDGRLDFSTNFHQRLLDLLDPAPAAARRSLARARDLIEGTQRDSLSVAPVGQFDPAAAGGPNSSPFGASDSLVNPWAYVLLVEGALLFAASAVRRHQHGTGRAAIPFTVWMSPDGSASGAEEASRGELWTPIWSRPCTLAEIRQLFTEARAAWRGRPAQRAVEFYAAAHTLGVTRGIDAFQRYGLHQRNGLAFVAVPVERVEVRERPQVRLAARLEDWAAFARRAAGSAAVRGAVRRFHAAHLAFARGGGALPLARLLAALTDLEQTVGRSGRTRDDVPVRNAPAARDFLALFAAETDCPELRVAVGIASCATRPGSDRTRNPARSMRQILLPIDPDGRWRATPVVAGFGLRPLRHVLADVLAWRGRTAADETGQGGFRGAPTFHTGVPVPAADLHALAVPGRLDDTTLDLWLRACLALHWGGVTHRWPGPSDLLTAPVPTLGLLHPLAAGLEPARHDQTPRLALSPDWATRLAAGQLRSVHTEAVRRLAQAGWRAVPAPTQLHGDGVAIAAALVPRCRQPQSFLRAHLACPASTEADPSPDQTSQDTEEQS
jgi:CRISPR-associated protein Csx17